MAEDGKAFAVLGKARAALRHAGATEQGIQALMDDATSDDYDHLLRVCMARGHVAASVEIVPAIVAPAPGALVIVS